MCLEENMDAMNRVNENNSFMKNTMIHGKINMDDDFGPWMIIQKD